MAIPVDFISLIKDIRGTNFDATTGLPTDGKWAQIKNWNTTAGISATQVATDLAATIVAKNSASASAILATSEASEAIAASDASQKASAASLVSEKNAAASDAKATISATASAVSATTSTASVSLAAAKATESLNSAGLSAGSATAATISATNSATSATASSVSATSAGISAAAATTSKNVAAVSEGNALTYSATASTAATNSANASIAAAASVTAADAKATEAATQKGLSANWAIGAEDLAITDGVRTGFSAFHWATKAAAAVAALGGVTRFTQMLDAPTTLVGAANKYLRVNAGETLMEFDALTKSDVGLNLVDNTADADKPISTSTQTGLNGKSSQSDFTTGMLRVTALEGNTSGLSVQAAAGADPVRLLADKEIYTSTTQVLATLQNAALTTFGLLKAALAAETIGTY